ncbi:MAG: alpha/beta fold hydrolase [Betaproteobacteria bacterium]|nr:alpha/beta fold hydrolase [Betaproteobacteria bacterium]
MASLAQSWFEPAGAARAVMVIAPAMGVRQDYYTAFAQYLSEHGILVVTFDYRYVGFNEPASLRGVPVTFDDWREDLDTMIEAAVARAPGLPLYVCGHSLGGQILGLLRNRRRIAGVLTVASGTGYWRHNPRRSLQLLYLWFFAMPLYSRLFGYFPGERLNKVGNLPREIALTWARWCRQPEYLMGDESVRRQAGYEDVRAPVLSFSFSDDTYIPRPAIEQLHGFYRNARIERHHISPADVGESRIGHFGFFKLGEPHALWRQSLQWLAAQTEKQTA